MGKATKPAKGGARAKAPAANIGERPEAPLQEESAPREICGGLDDDDELHDDIDELREWKIEEANILAEAERALPTTVGELACWLEKSEATGNNLNFSAAREIDGFDAIRVHCEGALMSSSRIRELCRTAARDNAIAFETAWFMPTGDFAAMLSGKRAAGASAEVNEGRKTSADGLERRPATATRRQDKKRPGRPRTLDQDIAIAKEYADGLEDDKWANQTDYARIRHKDKDPSAIRKAIKRGDAARAGIKSNVPN